MSDSDRARELRDIWGQRRVITMPVSFPKIICLCGSTRFKREFEIAEREETLRGNIVLTVGTFGHVDGLPGGMEGENKKRLDELHLRKIDLCDEVVVVCPVTTMCDKCGKPCELVQDQVNGADSISNSLCCNADWQYTSYLGESTRREITYATREGKPVKPVTHFEPYGG